MLKALALFALTYALLSGLLLLPTPLAFHAVWYIGLDTIRQMHDVMLPMMLAQLRDNLDAREIAVIVLNIALVLAAIALGGKLTPARSH